MTSQNRRFRRILGGMSVGAALAASLTVPSAVSYGANVQSASAAPATKAGDAVANHGLIHWQDWNDQAFQKAKRENKPMILDLEAVWCHWCHVMDHKTYADAKVANILNTKFVPMHVDQDNRPDLSTRYQDYGWPATILFSPNGKEIVKHAGFIPPSEMVTLLNSVVRNPYKVQDSANDATKITYSAKATLPPALSKTLLEQYGDGFDDKYGGWGRGHKFLDWDTVELALNKSHEKKYETMAKMTLNGELKLVDPVWGGVYQYSTDGDWVHPHFEKIMQMQAEDMRIFALASEVLKEPKYLQAAKDIQKFLKTFLTSPDGAFYTSMDADLVQGEHSGEYFKLDDAGRRKQGVPRVDKHIYARENSWAINGLMALYGADPDQQYLDDAVKAANWVIANRSLPNGGFRHDEKDKAGPYLDDNLAMGRAFLSLYSATGDRKWLTKAQATASFIDKNFKLVHTKGLAAGYAPAVVSTAGGPPQTPTVDQNVMVARFFNLLSQYTRNETYKKMAQTAMRFLASPSVGESAGMYCGGILLADSEISNAPAHVTVVGAKDDAQAKTLVQAALKYPAGYKVIEWWDRKEGPLPNSEIEFPVLDKAAAFGCAFARCSAPVYDPAKLNSTIESLGHTN